MAQKHPCRSCLVGVYSCHGKDRKPGKWQCACCWFTFQSFIFLLTLWWIYVCWAAYNDRDDFNTKVFSILSSITGVYVNWFLVVLIVTSVVVIYCCLLLVFALIQVALKEPLDMHWIHKVLLFLAVVIVAAGIAGICVRWMEEWGTALLSLQVTAPFLQLGGVAAVSLLGWFVFQRFFMAKRTVSRVFILMAYLIVVAAVFLSPLVITSPCLLEIRELPPKPALIGHRGAPMLAPENTMMSFQKSMECKVVAFESDVLLSWDGVPFLMHDDSLKRTTNVLEKFPERANNSSSTFSWKELQSLNAGDWYLENDPFQTVSSFSKLEREEVTNQSIPSLRNLLNLARKHNTSVIFDLKKLSPGHPYEHSYTQRTIETILNSSIPQHLVLWLVNKDRDRVAAMPPGFQQVYADKEAMQVSGGDRLNIRHSFLSGQEIRNLTRSNVTVNMWVVNERWLFSLLWCSGVSSVTTNSCHRLRDMQRPVWHLAPDTYRAIWITVDCFFLLVILGFFLLQRRLFRNNRGGRAEHKNGFINLLTGEMDTFL
ncbi:glycerophosphoinositol inositolphosphodiesterase GDPD2-like [Acipenser oxyrinchus oxyrinchus]|uniref:Glycerophosphoinositol inositolphosphodiesterase GDPD2-like n=1 Tax=Acipenser oxyrinchus oxyrinchus TaxID=40147 RepID=A0AAD8D4I6_ACIOX|nr:glycerophosphoinositol inositolphosphodiesterase GDPD2-like [Acipenser oxyrinchus oxyrinchus]